MGMGEKQIGAVIIGRNEGERLKVCLASLQKQFPAESPMVYVDSGSSDGSCEYARSHGFSVIELDKSAPFTAARGRNAGWKFLVEQNPELDYIQFIDGDCELLDSWLKTAIEALEENETTAIVCGQRKERFPDETVYNRLADMEWNTPIGEALACGGDAVMRVEALKSVNGYNASYICGEEPEMCIRMRRKGWKVFRLDTDMTLHDMDMHTFAQWWKRSSRAGWSIAEGYDKYGREEERYMIKEYRSGFIWGAIIPCLAILPAFITPLSLLLLLGYPVLGFKIYRYRQQFGDSSSHARLYAFWCVLSKFPQLAGQWQYLKSKRKAQQATLIEYK